MSGHRRDAHSSRHRGRHASATRTPQSAGGDFSAVITWGDGSTSAGVITGDAGSFSVTGGHTYNHAGDQDDLRSSVTGAAAARRPTTVDRDGGQRRALARPVASVTATEGLAFTGLKTVATFTDANATAAADDFTAVIDWGDGSTSLGTIVAGGNGTFT